MPSAADLFAACTTHWMKWPWEETAHLVTLPLCPGRVVLRWKKGFCVGRGLPTIYPFPMWPPSLFLPLVIKCIHYFWLLITMKFGTKTIFPANSPTAQQVPPWGREWFGSMQSSKHSLGLWLLCGLQRPQRSNWDEEVWSTEAFCDLHR